MPTTVCNIYREPFDVYVGRAGKGQKGTFGNPFRSSNRDDDIARFKDYFFARIEKDPDFKKQVHELRNKRLGCFCVPFQKCHASIIADYLNSLPEEPEKPIEDCIG